MAEAKRRAAVSDRGHLEAMVGAFYQSFRSSVAESLYSWTAKKNDNRNLFSIAGFNTLMQKSLWPTAGH